MAMLKKGDRVSWTTSQGRTKEKILRRQTRPTQIHKHKAVASKENPEFIVESEKSGKRAAHKAKALTKLD